MFKLFLNSSAETKKILIIGLTASVGVSLPIAIVCLTFVLGSNKEVSVKTNSYQFELSGQEQELKAVNDNSNEKLEEEYKKLKRDFNDFKQQAKNKNVDQVLSLEIEKLDSTIQQTEIRLEDVTESSEQYKDFVENVIAEPEK